MVSTHLKNISEIGSFPLVGMKTPRLAYPINISQQTTSLHIRQSFLPRLSFGSRTPASRQSLVQRQHGCAFRGLDLWLEVSGVRRHQLDDRNPTARNSPSMPVNVFESTFPYFSRMSYCTRSVELWYFGVYVIVNIINCIHDTWLY